MLNDSISLSPWVYRIDSLHRETVWPDVQNEVRKLLEDMKREDNEERKTYFSTPEEFLDTWFAWYKKWNSLFWKTLYDALGFEMHYVNTDPKSTFFKIWEHTWLSDIKSRDITVLNPIMLCADANGICDQSGYMNLWVNDMRSLSVLVYRWKNEDGEDISYSEVGKENFQKILAQNKKYYLWDAPERFPFDSANPLKAMRNIWHMIGFSPLSVYEKLEKLGFIFDTKR